MTSYRRRLLSFALVLTMLISLLPAGLSVLSASADDEVTLGKTTADKVNIRVGASTSAKLLFQIPKAGYVGTVMGETVKENIHWYKVEFRDPESESVRYSTGYVNAEFFTLLTAEEAAAYAAGNTSATPTPVPQADPATGATPSPTPVSLVSTDINAPAGTTGTLTNSGVNLRKGPSTGFGVITQLNRGDVVTVITYPSIISDKTFYRVNYNGTEGFIMSTFLRMNDAGAVPVATTAAATPTPAPEGVLGYVMTIKGGVNLRQTPGGTSITMVGKYRTFPYLLTPVKKDGYTWYFVQVDDVRGYLRSDCVKIVSEPTASPTPAPTPTPTPVPAETDSGSAPTAAPTAAPGNVQTGYVRTTAGGVNLRKNAGYTDMIGRIQNKGTVLPCYGDPVTVNKVQWYRVYSDKDKKYGYVHGGFVTPCNANGGAVSDPTNEPVITPAGATPTPTPAPTTDPATLPAGYVKTTAGGVNLRKNAGYTDMIGRIQNKGTILPYYGDPTTVKNVKWYRVYSEKDGKYGYVHGSYVTPCSANGGALSTPTPASTNSGSSPTAVPAVTPGQSQTEASYSTLKLGSSGNAVKNLVTELQKQGYYSGSIVSSYTTAVEEAVRKFQRDKDLTVDGIAGSATQHKLYGTVPIGAADTSNLTFTFYPAEKIDWYTGGIDELWARGSNYKVYDVKTGIVWWAHRWAGGNHVDAEPLTAEDTARLCKCYGVTTAQEIKDKNLYQRRPLLVTIGTRTFACSMYGVPHNYPEGDTIPDNNFKGQVCIHFTNSKTHDSNRVDSGHAEAIDYAWLNAPEGHI